MRRKSKRKLRRLAGSEIVEVLALQGPFPKSEALVGPQVVDPQRLRGATCSPPATFSKNSTLALTPCL